MFLALFETAMGQCSSLAIRALEHHDLLELSVELKVVGDFEDVELIPA